MGALFRSMLKPLRDFLLLCYAFISLNGLTEYCHLAHIQWELHQRLVQDRIALLYFYRVEYRPHGNEL